jgi:DNA replication protein DnaC
MPVEIDDAMLAREWTHAVINLDARESEICQASIYEKAREIGKAISHARCIQEFNERGAKAQRLLERRQRAVRYERACPFKGERKTNLFDLPFKDHDAAMSAFHVGKKSVTLRGSSGTGKTRLAWLLIEKPFMEGRSVRVFTHIQLKNTLYEKAKTSQAEMSAFVGACIECEVLLIDDLGKADMAKGDHGLQIEEQMFHILDTRLIDSKRQTVLTSNDDGASLIARMTPDRGEPLVRRINELTVVFSDDQTPGTFRG